MKAAKQQAAAHAVIDIPERPPHSFSAGRNVRVEEFAECSDWRTHAAFDFVARDRRDRAPETVRPGEAGHKTRRIQLGRPSGANHRRREPGNCPRFPPLHTMIGSISLKTAKDVGRSCIWVASTQGTWVTPSVAQVPRSSVTVASRPRPRLARRQSAVTPPEVQAGDQGKPSGTWHEKRKEG